MNSCFLKNRKKGTQGNTNTPFEGSRGPPTQVTVNNDADWTA